MTDQSNLAADTGLCRNCAADIPAQVQRCPACGSPRTLFHAELNSLSIAHLDCDAFYASVEKRDDPGLRDKPVIVGGGRRGVVSAACYIARIRGVHSAMPMFKALKLCPEATVIRPDMDKYVAVGRQICELMREVSPLVEPLSVDEAFLDLSGTQRLHRASPAAALIRLINRIERDIGVTASIGLSYNKFLAKLASDMNKPRGFAIIGRAEALDFSIRSPSRASGGLARPCTANWPQTACRPSGSFAPSTRNAWSHATARWGCVWPGSAGERTPARSPPIPWPKNISNETTFSEDIAAAGGTQTPPLAALREAVRDG